MMVAIVGRFRQISQHLLFVFFALAACCLALTVLSQLLEYRRWVFDRRRGSLLAALDTSVVTTHTVLVVSPPTVPLGTVVTSTGNKLRNVTGLDDVFISVKTTGIYHNTRITLLQRTWFTVAQNQVLEIWLY